MCCLFLGKALNQTTGVLVAGQAALPDPFRTQWCLGHLIALMWNLWLLSQRLIMRRCAWKMPGRGQCSHGSVSRRPGVPASSGSHPGPVHLSHLHLGPTSSLALVLCLESPDLLSLCVADSALRPGDLLTAPKTLAPSLCRWAPLLSQVAGRAVAVATRWLRGVEARSLQWPRGTICGCRGAPHGRQCPAQPLTCWGSART